jgi:phosphinothricin acetyltransferase
VAEKACMTLRTARPDDDAPAVQAVYAHHVLTGTATFELEPPSVAAMAERMAAVQRAGLPWLLALDDAGAVLGYAYAGPFRARPAYRHTVEDSVYLAPGAFGRGVGTALLRAVIDDCARADVRQMIAVIATPGGEASAALHRRLGFTMIGELPAVGRKFGRWLGTLYMQRAIGSGQDAPPMDEGGAG